MDKAVPDKDNVHRKEGKIRLEYGENQRDERVAQIFTLAEKEIRDSMECPVIRLKYQYAIDIVIAKLKFINVELTEQKERQVIRNLSFRIKNWDSICKKLVKKGRNINFKTAAETLNDLAGVRVVCFFCDDIYRVADEIKNQSDLRMIKEKDYVKMPKKSGYQSVHLIVGVPVTYGQITEEIRVEIQLRSFAMDYWAELDNQMCYKKSAGEIETVERESKDYSDVICKVDNKMLELRKKIEKIQNRN